MLYSISFQVFMVVEIAKLTCSWTLSSEALVLNTWDTFCTQPHRQHRLLCSHSLTVSLPLSLPYSSSVLSSFIFPFFPPPFCLTLCLASGRFVCYFLLSWGVGNTERMREEKNQQCGPQACFQEKLVICRTHLEKYCQQWLFFSLFNLFIFIIASFTTKFCQ